MVDLPDGEESLRISLVVLTQYMNVTRHRTTAVALQQLYTRRAITCVVNT